MTETWAEKVDKIEPLKPVHVQISSLEDAAAIEEFSHAFETGHDFPKALYMDKEQLMMGDNGMCWDSEDELFKLLEANGIQVRIDCYPPGEDPGFRGKITTLNSIQEFRDLAKQHHASRDEGGDVQELPFNGIQLIIEDFESMRKMAVLGFDFNGAKPLRAQEERLNQLANAKQNSRSNN